MNDLIATAHFMASRKKPYMGRVDCQHVRVFFELEFELFVLNLLFY